MAGPHGCRNYTAAVPTLPMSACDARRTTPRVVRVPACRPVPHELLHIGHSPLGRPGVSSPFSGRHVPAPSELSGLPGIRTPNPSRTMLSFLVPPSYVGKGSAKKEFGHRSTHNAVHRGVSVRGSAAHNPVHEICGQRHGRRHGRQARTAQPLPPVEHPSDGSHDRRREHGSCEDQTVSHPQVAALWVPGRVLAEAE